MHRLLRLAVSLALAAAVVRPAAAEQTMPAAAQPFEPMVVELLLNDQPQAHSLVVLRDTDGTLLVRLADLAQLRLRKPAHGVLVVDGERYLRLGREAGATVQFDEAAQRVRVSLPPAAFLTTRTAASSPDLPEVTRASTGAFVNYDLYGEQVGRRSSAGTILDLGIFGSRGVVTSSLVGRHDDESSGAVRLETTWTLDLPDRLATLRVGDSISTAGAWGRPVRFGGVQFGTNFATQPTLVTAPLLYAQGEAIVPSTVDVFVNGSRVASESVPPGPFTIDRVPTISGAGQMQIVITDALGRQQIIAQPYYTGPTLLRAGLGEYSVELGSIRSDYGLRSNGYGDLVMAGTYRRGFSDQFTAEVHAESQAGGATAAGVDAAWRIGNIGILSLTAAAGGDDDLGWLGGAGFERNGRQFSVFMRTQFASAAFAQLGSDALKDRPKQRSFAGMGVNLGRVGNLQVSYGRQTNWSSPTSETAGLSHSVTLGSHGYLSIAATRSMGADPATDVFVNWAMPFGDRRSVSSSVRYSPELEGEQAFEALAAVQKSLPPGAGMGYYLELSSDERMRADLLAQGDAGQLGLQYSRRNGAEGWRANASGGLAFTSAGVMAARRLDQSFAVVEVADFPDMTIYVENQPIGRTDHKGRVLLDSLRAYESNSVSIDPKELPLEASLEMPVTTITPAYRSGPVVRFPVKRASAATLRLVMADGRAVPAGALVVTRSEQVPVALDGLVYLTAAAGRQTAHAEWHGRRCSFEFERPAGDDPQPDLGDVTCR